MICRTWKPESHRLEDAFFPVALCDLKFVYPSEVNNGYNKTSCLKYQLGFCRWICQNGLVFESKSVDFVFTHKGVSARSALLGNLCERHWKLKKGDAL